MGEVRQRDLTIDCIKALGIFCMVAGHCCWPFINFVYLFHMAIFFIASGYCYQQRNAVDIKSVLDFIKKKISTLWFPYFLWTTIYTLCHNLFIKINVYTDNPLLLEYVSGNNINLTAPWTIQDMIKNIIKAFFMRGGTQMGSAFWFLVVLFEISIGYCIMNFFLNALFKGNEKKTYLAQWIISVILLFAGFLRFKTGHSYDFSRAFSYYILFHGGYTLKKYKILSKEYKNIVHVLIFAGSFIILIICRKNGSINLDRNSYENPLFLLITSFAGWQFLYEISFFICKTSKLKSIVVCIGQNTLSIVILHFLCFKIVNYIGVLINHQPLCLVAAFPFLFQGGNWWVAYSFVGLFIPVSLSILWKKLKMRILTNKNLLCAS